MVSSEIFDAPGAAGLTPATRGSRPFVEPLLVRAGLPAVLADALDDARWDDEIRAGAAAKRCRSPGGTPVAATVTAICSGKSRR